MRNILLFVLLLLSVGASAQLRLARLFTNHVVLQRDKPLPVWGWTAAKEKVTVTLAGKTVATKAGADGKWMVSFAPLPAGGPYELQATAKSGKAVASDVLIGEVWLCSGQSNMEFTVKQAGNFAAEKNDADYAQIRHFYVNHEVTLQPKDSLAAGEWKPCSAETVGDFTAVGFFYAREIYKKLHIPVGLLHSSWGGSQVEGWISKEGMASSDIFKDYAAKLPASWTEADATLEASVKAITLKNAAAIPTFADEKSYLSPGYDYSSWHTAGNALSQWDWQGIWAWRGNGYMAKTVDIPADFVSQPTTLSLAESNAYAEIYINGKQVSSGIIKGVRKINLPADAWRAGNNSLVLKLNKMIEPDWYGVGLMGNAADLFVASGDKKILIPTDNWKLMPAFAEEHSYAHSSNNVGTSIYNGMIAPLLPFAIRGALWYQGEANAGRAFQYRKAFPLMIEDWRKKWKDTFDFYFVQLANYGSNQNSNQGSNWSELREAQTMTLSLPKTGMAITTDIGNANDIHPTNKQDVGKRLAAAALKNTYAQNVIAGGPVFDSVIFENDKAILSFTNLGSGLAVKDKFGYLKGFEIAGEDKVFYYAKAEISGDKIIVYHPKGVKPAAVRYAWADSPDDANLYNKEGFPAGSFRTDNWKGITENAKFK